MSKNWGYIKYDSVYKSPELMVRQLLEIVSKGGNLLLNIGPTALGEITQPAIDRFTMIGKWMATNSEGIYGTRTWKVDGEILEKAPVTIENGKNEIDNTMKDAENDATSKTIIPEVRFLSKGNDLYAFVCIFRYKRLFIKTLSANTNLPIKNIFLIGSKQSVKWKQTSEGLTIDMPSFAVPEIPIVGFKIVF
jgi:alpha-L-fucosidase